MRILILIVILIVRVILLVIVILILKVRQSGSLSHTDTHSVLLRVTCKCEGK